MWQDGRETEACLLRHPASKRLEPIHRSPDEECQVLLDQLEETGDTEVADHHSDRVIGCCSLPSLGRDNRADEFYEVESQELVTHPTSCSRSKPTKNKPSSGES